MQALRVGGLAFESADDEAVNAWHERLNALWRNVASPHVALWVHVLRRRERGYPPGEFPPGFARELNERYRARLAGETLMVNEISVSLVYRPQPTAVGAAALRLFGRGESQSAQAELSESLEACAKLRSQVLAGLAAYEPEVLGLGSEADGDGVGAARVPGRARQRRAAVVAAAAAPVSDVLATSRLLFGTEAMEYRTPTRHAARRVPRHQGVPDAVVAGDGEPAADGAVPARADAELHVPAEVRGAGAAVAAVPPDDERRRPGGVAGGGS